MLEFISFWKEVILSLNYKIPLGKNLNLNVSIFGLVIASFVFLIIISVIYGLLSSDATD